MKKSKVTRSLLAAVSVVALSAVMYGCVHDGGSDEPPPVVEPEPPTAYEAGKAAIMAATTAAAAQAAYDAVDQSAISGAEAASLTAALNSRLTALATAARVAAQKMALTAAAGGIDTSDLSTAAAIAAANTAINALQAALDAAADVSDADKAMYQSQLDAAKDAVATAQTGLDTQGRMMAQRMAISSAVTAARSAVGMVDDDATDAEVTAADNAVAALEMAIANAADIPAGDTDVASAQGTLATLKGQLTTAKASRTAAMAAQAAKDAAAMAATAAKLYAGISAPGGSEAATRTAAYNDDEDAINVTIGTAEAVELAEDKKTTVAANHGWAGKRYHRTTPASAGTYEAFVYSNVEAPKQGRKFGSAAEASGETREYEYQLNAANNTELTINTGEAAVQERVASPSFDQSAGSKEFTLPANTVRVMLSGSYHGVSGTYNCTPTDANTKCSATVAAKGFTLGGGTWTFKPGNAESRVMSAADTAYASYGWWLHKSADGQKFTASAFHDFKGTAGTVEIAALRGTAKYVGGAAGKYALSSSTGGTNDAGHFTARATLNATFAAAHKISGTIDNFMGADGKSRNWSVELKEAAVGNDGAITRSAADDTAWTIDGTAAAASGEWSGNLREEGTDGVPKVAAGTFYSTYGTAGRIVGAFGANK